MATTAVSFRKGNTEENDVFAGVAGEIVADLGANEQVTENATIVLHTGNGQAGGIRMARADLNNITNESINNLANFRQDSGQGTYYGLLRRNLSNYMTNDVNAATVETSLKTDYHIASKDGHDINTETYIAGDPSWGNEGPIVRTAGGKYLMNRDLSNIHSTGENTIRSLSYTYWLNNINTKFLAEGGYTYGNPPQTYTPAGKLLAYKDMSNVNSSSLAEGSSKTIVGDGLAYANLTNVDYGVLTAHIDAAYGEGIKLSSYEWKDNKKDVVDPYVDDLTLRTQYPSMKAVINYTANLSEDFANTNLDNISTWEAASAKENYYKIIVDITNGGSDYSVGDIFNTGIRPSAEEPEVQIIVKKVSNGEITAVATQTGGEYCETAIPNTPYIDSVKGAEFIIHTETVLAGKLMLADLSNSDLASSTTQMGAIKYETTVDGTGTITEVDSVHGTLMDSSVNETGSFSTSLHKTSGTIDGVETRIAVDDTTSGSEKRSSIIVTKTNAYLNKNADISSSGVGEITDASHQLLNRGEMDARYQLQPGSATNNNIAVFNAKSTIDSGKAFTTTISDDYATASDAKVPTEKAIKKAIDDAVTKAVVYKGTVADETLLPSSGNTNGDLYWITAFSNNPPAGMTPGHPGTAIWNGGDPEANPPVAAHWDFKEDVKNEPDNVTIGYTNNSLLEVKLSNNANNAISVVNTLGHEGLYVNDLAYVHQQGYVAVAPVTNQSGKVLTNDGQNTSWTDMIPMLPANALNGVYHLVKDANGISWVNDNRLVVGPVTQ